MQAKGKEISPAEKQIMIKLFKEGKPYREIGRTVGRAHSSVQKVVQNYESTSGFLSLPRCGRPPILTYRETRNVLQLFQQDPTVSAAELSRHVNDNFKKNIRPDTIRKILKKYECLGRIPCKKPFTSLANRQKQIPFANEHLNNCKMSTKPALYYATLSPPSRAVLLTAKAIGLELELRAIDLLKGEHLTPEFIKINPQHTIPTLLDGDAVIIDSHAICSYLVEKYGNDDKLYPKDLIKRATVDARLHLDSGHLFARLRFLYEPILYNGSTDCSIDKIAYIQKTYEILEGFLKEQPYLCGDELTIADFCCVATVTSVNDVAPIDEFKFPKVLAWIKRLSELPYYKELNEEGAEQLKVVFKEKLAANRGK